MQSESQLQVPNSTGDLPRLRETIRAFIRSQVRDAALADDLTQETLIRIQTRLHTLRTPERMQSWTFQIARHAIADHFRKARETEPFKEDAHGKFISSQDTAPGGEEEELGRGLSAYVRSVVDRLPPQYREAIQLIELDGITQVELARRLGLSVSAAKSRVQRGRAMIRKEMERCCRWETDRYGKVLVVEPRGDCSCQGTSGTACEK